MNIDRKSIYPFFETIRIKDAMVCSGAYHLDRMRKTCSEIWGEFRHEHILNHLQIPEAMSSGDVKLNIFYNNTETEIKFLKYIRQPITPARLVEVPASFDYRYKYSDRDAINRLLQATGAGEIIIIRNGFVTDTSKANIIFEKEGRFVTPDTFLLNGTMRQYLLEAGKIVEARIRTEDISAYDTMYFINAMNPLSEAPSLKCNQIKLDIR